MNTHVISVKCVDSALCVPTLLLRRCPPTNSKVSFKTLINLKRQASTRLFLNSVQHIRVACIHWWIMILSRFHRRCPSGSVSEHFAESQEIPWDKKYESLTRFPWYAKKGAEARHERKGKKNDRGRARAIASIRERKSRLSREFLPILRGLLFGPRVSPCGERVSRSSAPCSDAQVHAGQESPFTSLTSTLSLSFSLLPPSTTIATTITTTVIIIGAALGRAPSPSSFLRPPRPTAPSSPHFPP